MNNSNNEKSGGLIKIFTDVLIQFLELIPKAVTDIEHQWLRFLAILMGLSFLALFSFFIVLYLSCDNINSYVWLTTLFFCAVLFLDILFLIPVMMLHREECRYIRQKQDALTEAVRDGADKKRQL
uniref:Uncharacterized protein n=1 Tax=Candidatus Kentrum sp. FW TaxID=2126338 RepID=A0A450TM60_9GAMM|nr:MAG: hypothetical protein BECKFW1821C_GA0114237_101612 [Candidatus Kentron sp. FW]